MRKLFFVPSLLVLSLGLTACANQPNAALEQARANVTQLQNSPEALKLAPLETKDALKMLDQADKAYRDGKKEENVNQLAYLTAQRAELAKQTIALKTGEAALKNKAMLKNPQAARQFEREQKDERNQVISNKSKARVYDLMIFVYAAVVLAFALMQVEIYVTMTLVAVYLFFIFANVFFVTKYSREM